MTRIMLAFSALVLGGLVLTGCGIKGPLGPPPSGFSATLTVAP